MKGFENDTIDHEPFVAMALLPGVINTLILPSLFNFPVPSILFL